MPNAVIGSAPDIDKPRARQIACLALLMIFLFSSANAGRVRVAAASNFSKTLELVVSEFTRVTANEVRTSTASTAALYAQIINGAPFDVFLAADIDRPRRLEAAGLVAENSRSTYAIGRLLLWSRESRLQGQECLLALKSVDFSHLAIANPTTAPYGAAAVDFLSTLDAWPRIQKKLVIGTNISQAMHFAATGNASFGLVAYSQSLNSRLPEATCAWPVPEATHSPIEQQLVLLKRAENNQAARELLAFLRGPTGLELIQRAGYRVPGP